MLKKDREYIYLAEFQTQKNQLSLVFLFRNWCPDAESNHGHGDFQSPALPTELSGQQWMHIKHD